MKRTFSIFIALILLLNCLVFTASANSTSLILEYKEGVVKKGETVKVSLLIENNTGFGTVSATIGFNSSNLELKSINKTYTPSGNYTDDFLGSNIANANQKGKVVVGYTPKVLAPNTYSTPITYNGVLAELTFVALKDCVVEAYFIKHELYLDDFDMTDVAHNTVIKKIKVEENSSSKITGSSNIENTSSGTTQNTSSEINTTVSNNENLTSELLNKETNTSNIVSNIGNTGEGNYDYLPILLIVLGVGIAIVVVALVFKKIKK